MKMQIKVTSALISVWLDSNGTDSFEEDSFDESLFVCIK